MNTTSWEQVRDESLAAMSDAERAEYDASAVEAEARLQLAELVYNARAATERGSALARPASGSCSRDVPESRIRREPLPGRFTV